MNKIQRPKKYRIPRKTKKKRKKRAAKFYKALEVVIKVGVKFLAALALAYFLNKAEKQKNEEKIS